MAHADYNCCAICDSKMDYSWEATTKEEICEECLKNIKELDLKIENIDDLKEFIKETDYKTLEETLIKLQYHFCYYGNNIDKMIALRFQPSGMGFEEYMKRLTIDYSIINKEKENDND